MQVVLMMLLGSSTIVYGIRKDEEKYERTDLIDRRERHANHTSGDCDGDDCDGDCEDMAEACGLQVDAFNRSAFFTCCTSAEWTCEGGKCRHSNRACLAAADEIFDENGEQRDCSGAIDLVQYHYDHADNDLEESIESGILERDVDGTVMAKGGKGAVASAVGSAATGAAEA